MVAYIVLFLLLQHVSFVQATLLDGSVMPQIFTTPYVFSDGDIAIGNIYFKQGFSVPAGATVTIAVTQPIDGAINLNGTGTLNMAYGYDLLLGPKCTGFTNGGILAGATNWNPGVQLGGDITIQGQVKFTAAYRFYLNKHTLSFGDGASPGYFVDNTSTAGSFYYTFAITFSNGTINNMQDASDGTQRWQAGASGANVYTFVGVNLYMFGTKPMTMTGVSFRLNQATSIFNPQGTGSIVNGDIIMGDYSGLQLNPGMALYLRDGFTDLGYRGDVILNQATIVLNGSASIGSFVDRGAGSFTVDGICTIKSIGTGAGARDIIFRYGLQPTIFPGATLVIDGASLSELLA